MPNRSKTGVTTKYRAHATQGDAGCMRLGCEMNTMSKAPWRCKPWPPRRIPLQDFPAPHPGQATKTLEQWVTTCHMWKFIEIHTPSVPAFELQPQSLALLCRDPAATKTEGQLASQKSKHTDTNPFKSDSNLPVLWMDLFQPKFFLQTPESDWMFTAYVLANLLMQLRIPAFPSAPLNHHGDAGFVALPKPSAAADPLGKMDEKWLCWINYDQWWSICSYISQ